jgi:LysR family nitrogen assimilation transcriptional regulator
MSLRQIRYFVAVAHAGSLSAAARVLNVSQPALTLQIRQLEQQLDVMLLTRHARGAELTKAGRAYLEHAVVALAALDRARQAVIDLKEVLPPTVSLGLTPTAAGELIPELLDRSTGRRPELILREGLSDELWRAVSTGELDAACCYVPDHTTTSQAVPLYREDFVLVGPPSILPVMDRTIDVTELATYPLVLGYREHITRRFIEQFAQERGVELRSVLDVEAAAVKGKILISRKHCSIVPFGTYRDEIEAGRLRAWRINPPFTRTAVLVTGDRLTDAARRFLLGLVRPLVARRVSEGRMRWAAVKDVSKAQNAPETTEPKSAVPRARASHSA